MQADVRYGRERKSDNDNNVDVQNPKGGYAMYLKKKSEGGIWLAGGTWVQEK